MNIRTMSKSKKDGQGDEKRVDCKRRNILYESSCNICNADVNKKEEGNEITILKAGKGIYVGESSRSLYERTKEHQADRVELDDKSHQIKHWLTDHADLSYPPTFRFKLIRSFTDPMTRQLAEAVRIELRGTNILNSRAEYNRCRVPRLKVDLEGWKAIQEHKETNVEKHLETEAEDSLQERNLKRKKVSMMSRTRRGQRGENWNH